MGDEQLVSMIVGRLDRLDEKMDAMAEALATQARIEERLANQALGMKYQEKDIEALENRVTRLEHVHLKYVGIATTIASAVGFFGPTVFDKLL